MTKSEKNMPDDAEEWIPSPEDFEEDERPPEGPLSRFPSRRHLLPALAMLVLFYAASTLFSNHPLGQKLWVSGRSIYEWAEYWRVITALFTHRDLVHLLSNAFMFIVFGWALTAYYGYALFPLVSLAVGALTNLVTVSIYPPDIRLLGASGMVYGMAALWLVFFLRYDTGHNFPARIFRVLGFIMVILIPSTMEPHVSYLAHGAGFLIGLCAGIVLLPFVSPRDPA
jgi:membrane associated rhomboid family serine protease